MTRASLTEVEAEDFARTARAKGVRERIVLRRHALRAAFNGLDDKERPISVDDVRALIVEASLLIALTMFLADVLRARLDPRSRMELPACAAPRARRALAHAWARISPRGCQPADRRPTRLEDLEKLSALDDG